MLEITNVEGRQVFADEWADLDLADIQSYTGLVILSGVYCSDNEAMAILIAVMSLETFKKLSMVLGFDDKQTRIAQ